MPWKETVIMNEKMKFIVAYLNRTEGSFLSLCERFSISAKTGYKYVKRYEKEGIDGLKELSRAPHQKANQMPEWKENAILDVKNHYPSWGAKKILSRLNQEHPTNNWPVKSSIELLLKRHNLVRPAKRKRVTPPYTEPFVLVQKPNDSWSIDYKGQFFLGNQERCYPLTITDNFSRYLLAVEGSPRISGKTTKEVLLSLFSEFGLPLAIRSDNGAPFSGNGLAGLSQLAVWLIKLGIIPERIRKGHPQENGRHERMHLTLKNETASPPHYNLEKQQHAFDVFKQVFNEERPHEGIGFQRPAWLYASSERGFPKTLPTIEYDDSFSFKRHVKSNGVIKCFGKEVFVSETLDKEIVAFKPYSEDEWLVYFSFLPIGIFNEKTSKMRKIMV